MPDTDKMTPLQAIANALLWLDYMKDKTKLGQRSRYEIEAVMAELKKLKERQHVGK